MWNVSPHVRWNYCIQLCLCEELALTRSWLLTVLKPSTKDIIMVEVFLDLTAVMFMVSLNSCLVPIVSSLILDSHPICASAFLLLIFMRWTFVLIPTFLCVLLTANTLFIICIPYSCHFKPSCASLPPAHAWFQKQLDGFDSLGNAEYTPIICPPQGSIAGVNMWCLLVWPHCCLFVGRWAERLRGAAEWETQSQWLCSVESLQARRAVLGLPLGQGEWM